MTSQTNSSPEPRLSSSTILCSTVFPLAICVIMQNPVTAISGTLSQTQCEKLKAINPSPKAAATSGIRRPKPRTLCRDANRSAPNHWTATRIWRGLLSHRFSKSGNALSKTVAELVKSFGTQIGGLAIEEVDGFQGFL